MVSPWAGIKKPTLGKPEVIGSVSKGCLAGAQSLPETGTGFVSIRRYRNRFYSHPRTIALIRHLGEVVARHSSLKMMIGDLSQPRGGLMTSYHRSHQNGMDVDIWFSFAKSVDHAREMAPEGKDPPSMLSRNKKGLGAGWGELQLLVLQTAAQHPEVDRIFVNPGIKLGLCERLGKETAWLQKLRPWWGHDAHFHVRLQCPKDSPSCKQQKAIPEGTGCGSELMSWFNPKPKKTKKKQEKVAKKTKPWSPAVIPACRPLLKGR
jgi:penicillin-insensitive murein endopeptidase